MLLIQLFSQKPHVFNAQRDGVEFAVDGSCEDVRTECGDHVAKTGVRFREEDGFVERCRVLERVELHQLVVLCADDLTRHKPADGADALAYMFVQVARPDGFYAAYPIVVERQRMPAHEEAERLLLVREHRLSAVFGRFRESVGSVVEELFGNGMLFPPAGCSLRQTPHELRSRTLRLDAVERSGFDQHTHIGRVHVHAAKEVVKRPETPLFSLLKEFFRGFRRKPLELHQTHPDAVIDACVFVAAFVHVGHENLEFHPPAF